MKASQIFLVLVLSAVVAFGVVKIASQQTSGAAIHESAYDRVLRTGVLRCGYAEYPPVVLMKDPATGKFSGMSADIINAVADKLNLKVEWTESLGWSNFIESLKSQRTDLFCVPVWRNAARGRYLIFSTPIFYSPVYAYVRKDDHRFDDSFAAVNDPSIRIATMDGEMTDMIANSRFPKAAKTSVPQLGQITDVLVNLSTGKADITFGEPSFVDDFIKSHPNEIRRAQDKPFEFFETSYAVDIHEALLRDMLDNALTELENNGVIDGIISKYNPDPKVFMRPASPYSTVEK